MPLSDGTAVVVTKVRRDLYFSHGTPSLWIRTSGCKADADHTAALLVLRGRLVFESGEVCSCSIAPRTPRTRREDWGVVRKAAVSNDEATQQLRITPQRGDAWVRIERNTAR